MENTNDLRNRCSRCGVISLKYKFQKKPKNDGLTQQRKLCRKIYTKIYYNERYDLEINRCRNYRFDKKAKINDYIKKRRESDSKFKLVCNLRSRTYKVSKSQNVRKKNKTFDLLRCSHSFFQR